jgi:hypothetical protein
MTTGERMAGHRPNVRQAIKEQLIEQTNGKCANPGCPNTLLELHHIREWHVYHTHDVEHMIAVCASCHDSVDRGELIISDNEIYSWKRIVRTGPRVGHVFIEPASEPPRILLGTISVKGDNGLVVFDFALRHRLSFAVRDGDIMLLNLRISSPAGETLVDVVDGYVRTRKQSIVLKSRAGQIMIPAGFHSDVIPEWVRAKLIKEDLLYGIEGMPLLQIRVVRPGLVRVNGIWCDEDTAVIATNTRFSFIDRARQRPLTLAGAGEETVLYYTGPAGMSLFNI